MQQSPSLSCSTALSHCSTSVSLSLHRSTGQVFHGDNGPVVVPGKATTGALCCIATFRASPQEWVPTTWSWNWEHHSRQLLWCSKWMQCWKQLMEKHSHGKAKLEYYTNLNTQKFVFGLKFHRNTDFGHTLIISSDVSLQVSVTSVAFRWTPLWLEIKRCPLVEWFMMAFDVEESALFINSRYTHLTPEIWHAFKREEVF